MDLYHYTCDHHVDQIMRDGALQPSGFAAWGILPLVWLTDMEHPSKGALGLTANYITCDRTRHRFTVKGGDPIEPWIAAKRHLYASDSQVPYMLEHAPGAWPVRWWVSRLPVLITDYAQTTP